MLLSRNLQAGFSEFGLPLHSTSFFSVPLPLLSPSFTLLYFHFPWCFYFSLLCLLHFWSFSYISLSLFIFICLYLSLSLWWSQSVLIPCIHISLSFSPSLWWLQFFMVPFLLFSLPCFQSLKWSGQGRNNLTYITVHFFLVICFYILQHNLYIYI